MMSPQAQELLTQVMALPDEDRVEIAEQLSLVLPATDEEVDDVLSDPEFRAELDRRLSLDHSQARPWQEVMAEIRAIRAERTT